MDLTIDTCKFAFPNMSWDITPHPQCMPDEYKSDDPVRAYRQYYNFNKKDIAKWEKSRPIPDWFGIKNY